MKECTVVISSNIANIANIFGKLFNISPNELKVLSKVKISEDNMTIFHCKATNGMINVLTFLLACGVVTTLIVNDKRIDL